MNSDMIVKAWKESEYRLGLDEAVKVTLPQHPAGLVELTDAELSDVAGGRRRRRRRRRSRSRSRSRS